MSHTYPSRPSLRSKRAVALPLLGALIILVTLAGCGTTTAANDLGNRTALTVGLTYVPNIQFAPFYVAQALGYYRDAGLNVTLRHHNAGEDEFAALAAGREQVIFAGGDETLQARAKGLPLVYVANIYTQYPVTLIVPDSSPVRALADLRGRTIGVPGQYGATYIGLLALLQSAGMSPSDVTIQSIGYTQVPALIGHKVDAVMGYINNEPIQFQKAGFAIRTFPVAATQPLISNGLAAPESELKAQPAAVKALVAATLKGVDYTIAHPQEAVKLSQQFVPGLSDPETSASALAVLQATLPAITPKSAHPGYNDPAAWQAMAAFLQASGQLGGSVNVTQAYSNDYLPS
ncbi:MAG TPA: ABC transporter substrate-binding protein [Ktedonobacterales bacterium]|nr:ABC transporter substrate-binding protein [Ktedonobacterales bacterium]